MLHDVALVALVGQKSVHVCIIYEGISKPQMFGSAVISGRQAYIKYQKQQEK
jgi:hypothetical protein